MHENSDPKPDLAALIGSRICHDLISPIGAISNGVELLRMEDTSQTPELALISESVDHANARIRFFRVAFGSDMGDLRIARGEVTAILSGMTRGGRVQISWDSEGDLSRAEVKLLFLMLMCLERALAYGGRITVTETAKGWRIAAEARRLRLEPALWDMLIDARPGPSIAASEVQFALAAQLLQRMNRRLVAELSDTTILMDL